MIKVKETLIRHVSDVIRWMDGTGLADQQVPVLSPLFVELDDPPDIPGLTLFHKKGHSLVWRKQQTGPDPLQLLIENGRATEEQRQRPSEDSYQIKGTISDPAGHFNPRLFQQTCGNNSYPIVWLYRTPAATRLSQQKQLQGVLQFQRQGSETKPGPASWALVRLMVNVSATSDTFIFNAQADRQGYFRIPLTRLTSSMLASGLSAVFSVKADKAQSEQQIPNPEAMTDVEIKKPGTSSFALTLNVNVVEENRILKFAFVNDLDVVSTLELKHT